MIKRFFICAVIMDAALGEYATAIQSKLEEQSISPSAVNNHFSIFNGVPQPEFGVVSIVDTVGGEGFNAAEAIDGVFSFPYVHPDTNETYTIATPLFAVAQADRVAVLDEYSRRGIPIDGVSGASTYGDLIGAAIAFTDVIVNMQTA
jgi:hypothetical protein